MASWEKTKSKIKGLEERNYGSEGVAYRLRQKIKGEFHIDYFGHVPFEEAVTLAAKIRENRKNGFGSQSNKQIQNEIAQSKKVEMLTKLKQEKAVLAENEFLKNHSVANYWDNIYAPKRFKKGSEKSNKAIAYTFDKYWRIPIGHMPIEELNYRQIEKVLTEAKETGKSDRMVEYIYKTLQAMYNNARIYFSAEYKKDLPVFCGKYIAPPTPDNKKTAYLTQDEVKELFEALLQHHNRDAHDMAVISLYSGLRFGDVASLKWSDIRENETSPIQNGKTSKVVYVDFSFKPIRQMLIERNKFALNSKPDEFIFTNAKGEKYKTVPKIFPKSIIKLGFNNKTHRLNKPKEKIDFHTLRRTFASWLVQKGVDLHAVRDLLGHNNISTTEIYAMLDKTKTQKILEKLI